MADALFSVIDFLFVSLGKCTYWVTFVANKVNYLFITHVFSQVIHTEFAEVLEIFMV